MFTNYVKVPASFVEVALDSLYNNINTCRAASGGFVPEQATREVLNKSAKDYLEENWMNSPKPIEYVQKGRPISFSIPKKVFVQIVQEVFFSITVPPGSSKGRTELGAEKLFDKLVLTGVVTDCARDAAGLPGLPAEKTVPEHDEAPRVLS